MSTQQIGAAVGNTTGYAATVQETKRPKAGAVAIVAGTVNPSGSGQIFPTGRR